MIKAAMWTVTIAVMGLVVATLIAGVVRPGPVVFAALLALSVALVAMLLRLVVELSPRVGAAGGALSAALCAAVLLLMAWAAPLAPGATRPKIGPREALAFAALMLVCGAAGWAGSLRRKRA
jgi:hypothetical protein